MSIINCTDPEELSLLANAFAIALAKGRSADELNILGDFINSVGDLITSLMATQKENLENQHNKSSLKKLNLLIIFHIKTNY